MMDASELATKMLEWEQAQRKLDTLENEIKGAILALGKSQTVGNVKATLSGGRRSFDYEAPFNDEMRSAWEIEEEADRALALGKLTATVDHNTRTVTTTDWRAVCKELGLEPVITGKSSPSVTIKLM